MKWANNLIQLTVNPLRSGDKRMKKEKEKEIK
jgi:hypothetical protein